MKINCFYFTPRLNFWLHPYMEVMSRCFTSEGEYKKAKNPAIKYMWSLQRGLRESAACSLGLSRNLTGMDLYFGVQVSSLSWFFHNLRTPLHAQNEGKNLEKNGDAAMDYLVS